MPLERHIEHEILIALLRIVARERDREGDIDGRACLEEAITDVVTDSGGSGDDASTFKRGFPSWLHQLILKPLLDAELLELLRLVLNNDSFAIKALIEKLINANFSNDKRLAIVKILSRAFERGNDGAEKVLTKSLSAIRQKPALAHVKNSVLDAVVEASEYTAQYYKIIEPKFNPQPRPRFIPKTSSHDDED